MSENPGASSTGSSDDGDEQRETPLDAGTGPDEADLRQESVGTAAEDPEEEGRFDAG